MLTHRGVFDCLPLLTAVFAVTAWSAETARTQEANRERPVSLSAGDVPSGVSDLRAMQATIQRVAARVVPSTVSVRVGQAHGSGVIINPEGFVLTAAHVAGVPGRRASLRLHDGRRLLGTTLGVFRTLDAGLIKIAPAADDEPPLPYSKMGDSDTLSPGQWCLATGHPGGFQHGRPPVLRVGRVLEKKTDRVRTDCKLEGGDSGGPLFDTAGQVVGIHSRIGQPSTVNLHVPVNAYRQSWERLAASEAWGRLPGPRPFIGVQGEASAKVARVARVFSGSPAEEAGIQVGDIITTFALSEVGDFDSLKYLVEQQPPGQRVAIEVQRGTRRLRFELTIGER